MPVLLWNCELLDPAEDVEPAPGGLLVEGERIAGRLAAGEAPPGAAERVDCAGGLLCPGLVDLHFHGRAIFAAVAETGAAVAHDARELARHGVTAFLATTVASPRAELLERVEGLAACVEAPPAGARPVGLHLEGPWIRSEAAGAQPPAGIRACDAGEARELLAAGGGAVRLVTLAPELPGAGALVEQLAEAGAVAALGHSLADCDAVDDAVARGARHVKHLWNAMGAPHHRAPGLAGAALADDRLSCDLICDGAHVDLRWVRVAARAKRGRLALISDRIDPAEPAAGFGAGPLRADGEVWRLPGGQLAGSRVTLERSVALAAGGGAMTRAEALAAATAVPARLLGLAGEIGTLRPGARADLALLDPAGEVIGTWVGGRRVH